MTLFYRIANICQALLICSNILFIIIVGILTIIVIVPGFPHIDIILQASLYLGQDRKNS